MSRPIMADSTWYIHYLRRGIDPFRKLGLESGDRDIATCGMVMSEVGRGVRDPIRLQKFQRAWKDMILVDSTQTVWDATMHLAWTLDRQGHVLPIQDLHIAACAMQISAVLLTFDPHFRQIPGLTVTDCLY